MDKVCGECGYNGSALSEDCPMCAPCSGCGRKLMQCECNEGN